MKSLFFVESPLQLLNANEALLEFDICDYIFYVRLSNKKNNDIQIKKLVKLLQIQNVIFLTINSDMKNIFDYLKLFTYRFKFIFKKNIDKVFIGNYYSGLFKLIIKQFKKEKIILLDDGTKTLVIQNSFNKHNFYNWYSMYKIKGICSQKIILNNFYKLKSELKSKNRIDNVLFLGADLSELNIVDENTYISMITKISHYYHKNILYIPHRSENEKKIKLISKIKKIKIKNLDYPVELYGLYEKEIPNTVASFYSTALLSMKNIYGLEAESFYFDFSTSEHKDAIESIYNYYKKEMKVINLDD